jgi:signal transduction histidine kinase
VQRVTRLGLRSSDAALPAFFGAVGTAELAAQGYGPLPLSIGTFWLACLVLAFRRTYPLAMPPAVAAANALAAVVGVDVSQPASWMLPVGLAALAAGLHSRRVVFGLASVGVSLIILMATLQFLSGFSPDAIFGLAFTLGPWVLGYALHRSLQQNRELATVAERERLDREAAVADERARIARELHDVLAHSLGLMVVQASVAEDLLRRDPERAAAALRQVQQSGRDGLAETAHLLRLIRDDVDELGMKPQRGLGDLPDLADEFVRAGLDVSFRVADAAQGLPVGVELSAYRIVQEALTNALKHAPGSRVSIDLQRKGDELEIRVHNNTSAEPTPTPLGGGHGLVGLRERVSLFGGSFRAGPTEDGGFLLAATLPARSA